MSLVEPPDPDDMWASIIEQFDEIEETGPDYSSMSLNELMELRAEIEEALIKCEDSIVNPSTKKGRELHSEYVALTFLIKGFQKRGLQT